MSEHYTGGLNKWIKEYFTRELTTADDVANYDVLSIRLEYRTKEAYTLSSVDRYGLKHVSAVYAVSRQEAQWSGNGLWTTVVQLLEDRCMSQLDKQYQAWLEKCKENHHA